MKKNLVFLFDVDNTLLDNDQVTADLKRQLENEVGLERQQRYLAIFEELRTELGYADYLGALQRYRSNYPHDQRVLKMSEFLLHYPFADRLFPNSINAVEYVKQFGTPVILSDGDVVFQPHKIHDSGLYKAFAGAVLIYIHKEVELADVEERYPADHYILIDDKLRILTAVKKIWNERVTTVFVRQGHYAFDEKVISSYPAADLTIERIGDLDQQDFSKLVEFTAGTNS